MKTSNGNRGTPGLRCRTATGLVGVMVAAVAMVGCSSQNTTTAGGTAVPRTNGSRSVGSSGGGSGDTTAGTARSSDTTRQRTGSPTTRSGGAGGGGAKAIRLGDTFEADGWTYQVNDASTREGEGVSFEVLDLQMAGVNNGTTDSLAGSLRFTIDAGGQQTRNCVADIKTATPPGGSSNFVTSCSLAAFDGATLDGATVTIADLSDTPVAVLTLG